MLFLLRNMRRKLISNDSKALTYLLYASGEILLVVIGILLAVQINSWYEFQKEIRLEKKILKEIHTDLQRDLYEIRDEIWSYQWMQGADSVLESFYYSSEPFTDTLGSFVYSYEISPHFNPINGGYQLLKSKGIDVISNDSLRLLINSYYEQHIPYYQKFESERLQMVLNEFVPLNNELFYLYTFSSFPFYRRMPFDERALHQNKKWISVIQKSRELAGVMTNKCRNHEREIIELSKKIQTELALKN